MLYHLRALWSVYPRQFWLLFFGLMISTIGSSMIWPFQMIYASERLGLPLTAAAGLVSLNWWMGLLSSFVAGPIIDRAGRKWVMAISLFVNGLAYLGLSHADTLPEFALLMGMAGAFNPLYRVGADAMMGDLIGPEKRVDAYSLLRTSNNVGVALGPAIGGIIASNSYTIAFYCAAAGLLIYSVMVTFLAGETLPAEVRANLPKREPFGGYGRVLKDRQFMAFIGAFTLTQFCASLIWILMGVYAKQNFGVEESQYGFIPTVNALMVIFFQFFVTQVTKRHSPLGMLTIGSLFYAVAVGSVALAGGFWGFLASMVVLTIGELILSPTATTMAANLSPAEMRGRYMSIYGLTWGVAAMISPIFGGLLNDYVAPAATWVGGGVIGAASVIFFLVLIRRYPKAGIVSPMAESPTQEASAAG